MWRIEIINHTFIKEIRKYEKDGYSAYITLDTFHNNPYVQSYITKDGKTPRMYASTKICKDTCNARRFMDFKQAMLEEIIDFEIESQKKRK